VLQQIKSDSETRQGGSGEAMMRSRHKTATLGELEFTPKRGRRTPLNLRGPGPEIFDSSPTRVKEH